MTLINCYCGSHKPFTQCCQPYHDHLNAPTALALMKSRFSAFCCANVDYLEQTQRGKASLGFDKEKTHSFAQSVHWLSLQIVRSYQDKSNAHIAYVEFVARFLDDNQLDDIHELSQFEWDEIQGRWYYCHGIRPKKAITIAKNQPCPCGSQRKYKHCHAVVKKAT